MIDTLSRVLIIDDSAVFRDMLKLIFKPHCEEVLTASGAREGIKTLAQNRDLSLVVSDVVMPDGSGFDVLRYVAARDGPKPRVILVTGRPVEDDARRASELGAIGYLNKPTSFRDIRRVLRRSAAQDWNATRPPRRRTLGRALLADPDTGDFASLAWDIHDLSRSGAFLETPAPLPVGTELFLILVLGDATARVRAEVIRVQEPSWGRIGGVGVAFRELLEGARDVLEHHIADAPDEIY